MGEYINSTIYKMLDKLEKNRYTNSEDTIELGLEVYALCVKASYEIGMAVALFRVGGAYFILSKYENAMPYLFDSLNLSQNQGVCDLQLLTFLTIGDIYFDIGEYEKSLDYYKSAEKLLNIIDSSKNYYKDISQGFYAAKVYNNIGEIYRILKCYDDAIIYYNLTVELDSKLNYKATFGVVLSNLGSVECQMGNYDSALTYLNESLIYLRENDYKIGILEAYGIIALVYEKKANYEQGEKYFLEALNICSEISYDFSKIDVLLDFSNFLENTGKTEQAIDKLEEVFNISIENKMYAKVMEICKRAISLYEKANDMNNANRYYKLYFENEKKLEHIRLEDRATNLKLKIKLHSLEQEKKSILEKNEEFRMKSQDLIEIIKNISIISDLGGKITTTLNLNEIYEMLEDTVKIFMKANSFGVGIYNREKGTIEYKYLIENNVKTETHKVNFDNEASVAVRCLKENRIIVINDMHNEYLDYIEDVNYINDNKENFELKSAIYCPLVIDNNLIGVITVQAFEKNSFTMLTTQMIKALSSYAAIAINNAMKSMNLLVEIEQRRKIQTQLEDTNNKLIFLSENDGLTGIPNRRKFDATIDEEWNKAKKKNDVISIIIFDIDCFKQYNDNYGHAQGDSCLIKISEELSKSLVKNYFAARYGGDEFVMVLPDTNLEQAKMYGENFRLNVEKLSIVHEFSKVKDIVTVTIGVACVIPSNELTITEFIRRADDALYEAKNRGRNQVLG